ncbi:MAG: UDP-N-acetylmuramate--L-alanine ligase [Gammaproteobacteria bacterium]|nr:UDP-N-acetylmuramate--L-alanine ligase [Gammaproteobacteria bacterium]
MRSWVNKVHFVGIGGVGMCGIAEVLCNLGFSVSGSDLRASANTSRLSGLGAAINIGHDAGLVHGVDVVVVSSAIDTSNPEVAEAIALNIPVIPRAEMLGELMQLQRGIAIAGTHGKTSTTSLVASILAEGGLDPTFVIGGRLNSAGTNARLGKGDYLVAEADESDASFIHLHPLMAVVTNVDADHMSTYEGDFEKLKQTFVAFLHNLPFYGMAVLCYDDTVVRELLPRIHKPVLTYGETEGADYRISDIRRDGRSSHFVISKPGNDAWSNFTINQPGTHNILNATAAIAVADVLGVAPVAIQKALQEFAGIGRRLQINGEYEIDGKNVLFIDDYAHHPTEIRATLEAVRQGWQERRLVTVFQPHRYSRTHDLMDDFSAVLAEETSLVITEVYAAGEKPQSGADGRALCRAIRARGQADPVFVDDVEQLSDVLVNLLQDGDLVLTMGAGSIGQVAAELSGKLNGAEVG